MDAWARVCNLFVYLLVSFNVCHFGTNDHSKEAKSFFFLYCRSIDVFNVCSITCSFNCIIHCVLTLSQFSAPNMAISHILLSFTIRTLFVRICSPLEGYNKCLYYKRNKNDGHPNDDSLLTHATCPTINHQYLQCDNIWKGQPMLLSFCILSNCQNNCT